MLEHVYEVKTKRWTHVVEKSCRCYPQSKTVLWQWRINYRYHPFGRYYCFRCYYCYATNALPKVRSWAVGGSPAPPITYKRGKQTRASSIKILVLLAVIAHAPNTVFTATIRMWCCIKWNSVNNTIYEKKKNTWKKSELLKTVSE